MSDQAMAWWCRLWAIAILAHLFGNSPTARGEFADTGLGIADLLLGLAAIALLAAPTRRRILGAVAGLTLLSVWFEAPFIGNHWLVAGFISVALLWSLRSGDWFASFAPAGRLVLVGFYGFAAFAKLNSGFFDPSVSCGAVYVNQLLGSWGLPHLTGSGWALTAAVLTAAVELSVFALLLSPKTRRWGVVLGMVFHLVISFDLDQHFFDFTALLIALFSLHLDGETLSGVARRLRLGRPVGWATLVVLAVMTAATVIPQTAATVWLLRTGVFVLWIPVAVAVVVATAVEVRRTRRTSASVRLRSRAPLAVALAALVVFNGLTPYLELKTGYGFNMYANLVTTDGVSNHLIIRRTLPLTDVQAHLVQVESSDDPVLSRYAADGYLLPERNLRDYLASHPAARAVVAVDGRRMEVSGADFGRPLPVLVRKFQLFRAVDRADPPRCQLGWLPAA